MATLGWPFFLRDSCIPYRLEYKSFYLVTLEVHESFSIFQAVSISGDYTKFSSLHQLGGGLKILQITDQSVTITIPSHS
jgi:hypothetical protein